MVINIDNKYFLRFVLFLLMTCCCFFVEARVFLSKSEGERERERKK